MPNAVPAEAAAQLPPARMIDPRGHRFGAAVGALLIVSFVFGWVPGVLLALLSIGVSAAFGLKYSIYGAIWRRIVKVAKLGKAEPEHEYPPRFAQTLGSIALLFSLLAFGLGAPTRRLDPRPRRRRAPDAARRSPATASAAGCTSCAGGSRTSSRRSGPAAPAARSSRRSRSATAERWTPTGRDRGIVAACPTSRWASRPTCRPTSSATASASRRS